MNWLVSSNITYGKVALNNAIYTSPGML